mgnify:CR=1 FL=1|jgi:hypothetical protein
MFYIILKVQLHFSQFKQPSPMRAHKYTQGTALGYSVKAI